MHAVTSSLTLASSLLLSNASFPSANAFEKTPEPAPATQRGTSQRFIQTPQTSAVRAVWVNPVTDKLTKDETPALKGQVTTNLTFNGSEARLAGIRGTHEPFSMVLETAERFATNVQASFSGFTSATGQSAGEVPLMDLYVARYLQINGLSQIFGGYDEAKFPKNFQLPSLNSRLNVEGWTNRPAHNKHMPDIMIPIEDATSLDCTISPNNSKIYYADIFIPDEAAPGDYRGTVTFTENGAPLCEIPVTLTVQKYALPFGMRGFTFLGREDMADRFFKKREWELTSEELKEFDGWMDEAFKTLRRYGVEAISNDYYVDKGYPLSQSWKDRFTGALFTKDRGYHGPGEGKGTEIYSIGTYSYLIYPLLGSENPNTSDISRALRTVIPELKALNPNLSYYLWLIEEGATPIEKTMRIGQKIKSELPGLDLPLFGTLQLPHARRFAPDLDIMAATFDYGHSNEWNSARLWMKENNKKEIFYNAYPPSGTFVTEDYGTSLLALAWGQAKLKIGLYFFWAANYYDNSRYGHGRTDVFNTAHTFGVNNGSAEQKRLYGEWGSEYANGNGILIYPGQDKYFQNSNYGVKKFFPSLRLMIWGRGLEDVKIIEEARKIDPVKTDEIVRQMVPKTMWEYGVADPLDPTYNFAAQSWHNDKISGTANGDRWIKARRSLIEILENAIPRNPHLSIFKAGDKIALEWEYAAGDILQRSRALPGEWTAVSTNPATPGLYELSRTEATENAYFRVLRSN